MEVLKIAALALCAVILIVLVKNYKPELGMLTALACSLLILYFLTDSMKYAFAYIAGLYHGLENGKTYFPIIMKVLAIAYITEFTSQLCKDAGENSIALKIENSARLIIAYMSLPAVVSLFEYLLDML